MTFSTLAGLVAPSGASQFFDAVQGRTHQRFPGRAGRFADLLPWSEVNRVLRQHPLEHPRLRLAQGGEVLPAHTYTETSDTAPVPRLSPAAFTEKMRGGATLVMDAVHELFEPVGELAAALEHELRERVRVNLYAGWGVTHGFDVHWDDHDVIIVQVSGRKRWRLHGSTRPAPLRRDVELPPRPSTEPLDDFVLEDGDVLYVPRGHWHDVSAVGEESLHLTIGFNRATGVDLVSWLADQLRAEEAFRTDLPRFASRAEQEAHAAVLRAKLTDLLDAGVVARFLADRDAQAPALPHVGLPWTATPGLLPPGDEAEVRLLTPRAVLAVGPETVTLAAAGKSLVFAAAAGPVLEVLVGSPRHTVKSLVEAGAPTLDRATVRALLAELVTQGVVGPE
ncbi:cupin domain-containing protein [Actinosynnema sp. NPDC047251]|uniref:Cupin 2 barrel domain-containing protein n=1 Tax=Saccharothrix espanaensis (strain ATCC 51144 / DSM 44229 / JCM 9112 / NBRC 15066 / NRRL 15764) TaxID=1179773 RepID=K0K052_SACES|nr:cupin domain-containing protein [Saccharothrix espanaensis]CCH33590.1 Cupin 2 barrel domain-containing protein [Saccharothrix espanaensis DSM 44229]